MQPSVVLGLLVLAVGSGLRLVDLGRSSYWLDEATTAAQSALVSTAITQAFHPPGYYLLAWAAQALLGSDEGVLRGLSAIAGVATVLAVAGIARELGRDRLAGAAAALMLALSPAHVHFSREARMYALWTCGIAIALYGFARLTSAPASTSARRWYVAGLLLAALTHYYAAFYLLALSLLLLPVDAWRLDLRAAGLRWGRLHGPVILTGVALLTWMAALRGGTAEAVAFIDMHGDLPSNGSGWSMIASLVDFRGWALRTPPPAIAGVAIVGALGVAWWAAPMWAPAPAAARRWLMAGTLPALIVLVTPLRAYPRLILPLLLPLAVLGGVTLAKLGRAAGGQGAPVAIGVTLLLGISAAPRLTRVLSDEPEPWRAVAADVAGAGVPTLVSAEYMTTPLLHYLPPAAPRPIGFPDPDLALTVPAAARLAAAWPELMVVYSHTFSSRLADVDRELVTLLQQRGFTVAERAERGTIELVRLRGPGS
jgi:4-amino-4-deoxy-L-arabinose transferase-like glycosyltransferase